MNKSITLAGLALAAVTLAHGWLQWVLMAGAVFLPYMGVLLANQADATGLRKQAVDSAPEGTAQLTTGPEPEYVEGVVVDDEDDRRTGATAA